MNAIKKTTNTRRHFLFQTAVISALPAFARLAGESASQHTSQVISQDGRFYYGWPTVGRTKDGRLICVSSAGREGHVCPFGRVELMISKDEGKSWGASRVILDSDMDDRDAGFCETPSGTLLVTTFSSLAYEPMLARAERGEGGNSWTPERLKRWQSARVRLSHKERQQRLGVWVLRSTDGGLSWSAPIDSVVNSPHGPIALKNGDLFYAGKKLWSENKEIGVAISKDDGQTWQWVSEIPAREGDRAREDYHELHAVEADDGTLVVQIRNHSQNGKGETLQTESKDGGKTWSEPHSIGVWGLPSHLTKLRDGRLLMTYGHRRKPYGNQARVSDDHGKTWGPAIMVSDDATNGDLGYPSTVQLSDGRLLTVWYELLQEPKQSVLRQAIWSLEA